MEGIRADEEAGVGDGHPSEPALPLQQERPKSAVFPTEGKVKMSVEEQIDRMRRHQSGSMKEKRRSLQLPASPASPASPAPDPAARPAYKVVKSSQPPSGRAGHLPNTELPQSMTSLDWSRWGRGGMRDGPGKDPSWAPGRTGGAFSPLGGRYMVAKCSLYVFKEK